MEESEILELHVWNLSCYPLDNPRMHIVLRDKRNKELRFNLDKSQARALANDLYYFLGAR